MKKYLFSVAAVAVGLAVAGTAQAARGPHGGPTMIKSVTSGGSTYRTFTPAKGTMVKTGLPAKTGTTIKKTTIVKKTVTGTGTGKGSGKVAPKWIKFGGKNYKTLSAGSKFKYCCWHKGYGCWCFWDYGCGWCFWCARYSCFLPYACISYAPPAADDQPEVGGEMPPVLPGTAVPKPKTETPPPPPPPPPGADGEGEKASTKDGGKDGEKASTKDGDGEKDAEKAGTKDADTDGDSDS